MRRFLNLLILLPVLPVLGCASFDPSEGFDTRLRGLGGKPEREVIDGMGRIPDNSYQLDADTKILQWRWDTSYVSPGMPPMYRRVGGNTWLPMGGFPPSLVREGCIVEWTVTKGNAQSYRFQGNGCRPGLI